MSAFGIFRTSQLLEALVNKAAALVDSEGKVAFTEFRKQNSEWFHDETYIYAHDLKGNVLFNAAFPAHEGTNIIEGKDSNGKLFQDEIITAAQAKESGWVDYMFPKPGQTEPSRKWAFIKAVEVDGMPILIASGFYPDLAARRRKLEGVAVGCFFSLEAASRCSLLARSVVSPATQFRSLSRVKPTSGQGTEKGTLGVRSARRTHGLEANRWPGGV